MIDTHDEMKYVHKWGFTQGKNDSEGIGKMKRYKSNVACRKLWWMWNALS
jgi:hypothetical protein